jgi:hypothetical protein
MSTERSPALDGTPGNSTALKKDLAELGVFHPSMSLYLFFKPREYDIMGFSGFEGRHYSLFEGFEHDFGRAALLQAFITSLAFRHVLHGTITHRHIPDTPFVESERRQVIFNAAIGIPTFYMKTDTGNLFLKYIVMNTSGVRNSRRYPGYIRVPLRQYLEALVKILREDSGPLPEMFGMADHFEDLLGRVKGDAGGPVASRLTRAVAARAGAGGALDLDSEEFNLAAEHYYRTDLRRRHLRESLAIFRHDLSRLEKGIAGHDGRVRTALEDIVPEDGAVPYLMNIKKALLNGYPPVEDLRRLIRLIILTEHAEAVEEERERETHDTTPVHRAGNA